MEKKIIEILKESLVCIEQLLLHKNIEFIKQGAELITICFEKGNKILIAGNGGSLCEADHFAEELTGFFRRKRKALPALSLSNPGHLTCVGNDLGFEAVFSRGIEALGKKGDLFIGLSTSGNSLNLIKAFETAKEYGLKTMAFLGREGGTLKGVADLELIVSSASTSDRIQEAHLVVLHVMIQIVEMRLFGSQEELTAELLEVVS